MKTIYSTATRVYAIALSSVWMLLSATLALVLVTSCTKNSELDSGVASLSVSLEGIELDAGSTLQLASATAQSVASSASQEVSVALNSGINLVATLSPITSAASIKDKLAASGKTMSTTPTTNANVLETGVQYRLVVYDASNNYVTDKVYTKGSDNNDVFYLEVGKSYTFISFSINSKATVPAIDTSKKLTELTLANIDGNGFFMYFKKTITLVKGDNYLGIKLKHVFSEITTTLDASALAGNIVSCSAQVAPHYTSVGVKLNDGSLVGAGTAGNKAMVFGAFGGKTVTSTATKIALPATTAGTITLSSIQVGNVTRSNLLLSNLTINPGVRYTLKLSLQAAGANGIEIGGYLWAPGNLVYNNGVYGFAATQSDKGNLWRLNSLDPYPGGNTHWQTEYKKETDPCAKVLTHGGGWRTPTYQEFSSIAGKRHGEMPIFHIINGSVKVRAQYKGVYGVFIGTNTQPAEADVDKFLFLPYGGRNDEDRNTQGSYWTITPTGSNHYRFQFNFDDVSFFTGDYHVSASSIRCVKNK
ncbi:hypothetical protein PQ465_18975 [Sphingobacterium oryzagri]|uniref:Uncharacterized protein n=1 Tax=Sphingobacterium oryzagri TaxID=3025669 RepID=A0ABY7WGQ7_9SPHI|nr:hypothetical protein [Sphingobacterium sp. KACC 22765]WDF68363.1 hypothetical protein PQ465_18975 [Sphingobacterium sp. KACC 22765]